MKSQSNKKIGLTLTEVLIAMLILSITAAGVLASFSYAFKFSQRAGKKIEALNFARKTQEACRAIWLANPDDPILNIGVPVDAKSTFTWLAPSYDRNISVTVTQWPNDINTKQIDVIVNWEG